MQIIDSQLHSPAPNLAWHTSDGNTEDGCLEAELSLAYLDALGIHGAILFPVHVAPAAAAVAKFPGRLAYVPFITMDEPDIEATVRAAAQNRAGGQLGLRAIIGSRQNRRAIEDLDAGLWDPLFDACERYRVPVFLTVLGWPAHAARVAEIFPALTLILDHIGLRQPPFDTPDDPPFNVLSDTLALARFANVYVKMCGVPSLSRQPFPFRDVAWVMRSLTDAFGAERIMWASDATRFSGRFLGRNHDGTALPPYAGKHSSAESLLFVSTSEHLSDAEKSAILGGTVRRVFDWPTSPHTPRVR